LVLLRFKAQCARTPYTHKTYLDDLSATIREFERLASHTAVKLLAVQQLSGVVHSNFPAGTHWVRFHTFLRDFFLISGKGTFHMHRILVVVCSFQTQLSISFLSFWCIRNVHVCNTEVKKNVHLSMICIWYVYVHISQTLHECTDYM
jgi:hypothetical protein